MSTKAKLGRWLNQGVVFLIVWIVIVSCSPQPIPDTPIPTITSEPSQIPTQTFTPPPTVTSVSTNIPVPTWTLKPIFYFGPEYDIHNTNYADPDNWPVVGFWDRDKWIPFVKSQLKPEDIPTEPLTPCNYTVVTEKLIGGDPELQRMMFDSGKCNQQIPIAAVRVGLWEQPDGTYLQYLARITYIIRSQTELNGKDYVIVSFDIWLEEYSDKNGHRWLYEKMFPCIASRCADMLPYFRFTTWKENYESSAEGIHFYYTMQHPPGDEWKQHAEKDAKVIEKWLTDTANPPSEMDGMTFPGLPAIYK